MEDHGIEAHGVYPKVLAACSAKGVYEDTTLWISESKQFFFH